MRGGVATREFCASASGSRSLSRTGIRVQGGNCTLSFRFRGAFSPTSSRDSTIRKPFATPSKTPTLFSSMRAFFAGRGRIAVGEWGLGRALRTLKLAMSPPSSGHRALCRLSFPPALFAFGQPQAPSISFTLTTGASDAASAVTASYASSDADPNSKSEGRLDLESIGTLEWVLPLLLLGVARCGRGGVEGATAVAAPAVVGHVVFARA